MLLKLEHSLSPYVAFGIMPLFAFANAGVSLEGLTFATLLNPVPLGIVLGLFLENKLSLLLSYISVKLKLMTCHQTRHGRFFCSINIDRNRFYNEFICWKFSIC